MPRMIFVNLPVKDLKASMAFYKSLGFENNPHFTDEATSSEVMLAISCESRDAVDAMNKSAASHGGTADINPAQDLGFMYNRNLADPYGHIWEALWMDPAAIPH